jgi:hypothetical protein
MKKPNTHGVARIMVRCFGYAGCLRLLALLEEAGLGGQRRRFYLPSRRTLKYGALSRLGPGLDVGMTAAKLGMRPAELRKHLRRTRKT